MLITRTGYLKPSEVSRQSHLKTGISRAAGLAASALIPLLSETLAISISAAAAVSFAGAVSVSAATPQALIVGAPPAISAAGTVSIESVAAQSLTITAAAIVSSSGSVSASNASPQSLTVDAPASLSSSGKVALESTSQSIEVAGAVSTSSPGTVSIANADPQTLILSADSSVATAGNILIDHAPNQELTITAPSAISSAGSVLIAHEGADILTVTAPASVSTAGSVALDNATPQAVSISAPASGSSSGSVGIAPATPQTLTVNASAAVSSSGSVGIAPATPQALTVSAPTSASTPGDVSIVSATPQTLTLNAAASVSTPGSVSIAPQGGLSFTINAPTSVSTAGSILASLATPQELTINAASSVSTPGSTSIALATPQSLTVDAPATTATSGSVSIALATPQTLTITAPASVSSSGSVSIAAEATIDLVSDHVSHYGLDEVSGTRYDWVGANNLQDNNTVGYELGYRGNAALFNAATNESLSCADNAALSVTGALTISAWIKPTSVSGLRGIVSKYLGTGNQRSFALIQYDNTVGLNISDDGVTVKQGYTGAVLTTGEKFHLVGVFDPGNSIKIWVNGTLVKNETTGIPSAIFDSTAPLEIGAYSGSYFFSGAIDHVDIFARAMNAAEIAALNNSGTPLAIERYADPQNTEWYLTDDPKVFALWDATDESTITKTGNEVTQLADKVGLMHLTPNTTGPDSGTRAINGHNVLDFQGEINFENLSSGNISRAFAVCLDVSVFSVDEANSKWDGFYGTYAPDHRWSIYRGDNSTGAYGPYNFGSGFNFSNYSIFANGPHVVSLVLIPDSGSGDGEVHIYVDGNLEASQTALSHTFYQFYEWYLGQRLTQTGYALDGAFMFRGLSQDTTESNRQKWEGYAAHKAGIAANLPSGHPYKNSPPVFT